MDNPLSFKNYHRIPLQMPVDKKNLLLHVCCVVCAGEIIEELLASGIKFSAYFYNPNIDTIEEYERRLLSLQKFCELRNVDLIVGDYNPDIWQDLAGHYGAGREGGERCGACFSMRLQQSAEFASDNGYNFFATTLGISRWKNLSLIDKIGFEVAESFTGVDYWDHNWRKKGGSQRMFEIANYYDFYQQNYCGCSYSVR